MASHPTTNLNEHDILRALLGKLSDETAQVRDLMGIMRLESQDRHAGTRLVIQDLSNRVDVVVGEVEKLKDQVTQVREDRHNTNNKLQVHELKINELETRLAGLEKEIERVRTEGQADRNAIKRSLDEDRITRKAEMAAFMEHASKVDRENVKRDSEVAKISQSVGVLAEEFGVADKTDLGDSKKPLAQVPKLQNIEQWARNSKTANFIVIVCVAIDIIYRTVVAHLPQ